MKEAKCLLMSDVHVNTGNLIEFKKNWMEAFDVCRERGIKDVFIAGDIFTAQSSQTLPVLMAVLEMFEYGQKHDLLFFVSAGNHDKPNKEAVESYCHLYRNFSNVVIVDEYYLRYYDKFVIGLISYFPENSSFKEKLDKLKQDCCVCLESVILYIHEGVKGALGNFELESECPVEWFEGFGHVFCGHYHDRKHIPHTNIEYIGSSRQNNFGENEEKGYTVVYEDGSVEFIKNKVNIRYRTVEAVYGEEIDIEENSLYKTRLKLSCTSEESKTIDKDSFIQKGFNKIEITTEKIKSAQINDTDINQRFDKAGIQKEYKNFCNRKEIEPELGLKYLEKI